MLNLTTLIETAARRMAAYPSVTYDERAVNTALLDSVLGGVDYGIEDGASIVVSQEADEPLLVAQRNGSVVNLLRNGQQAEVVSFAMWKDELVVRYAMSAGRVTPLESAPVQPGPPISGGVSELGEPQP